MCDRARPAASLRLTVGPSNDRRSACDSPLRLPQVSVLEIVVELKVLSDAKYTTVPLLHKSLSILEYNLWTVEDAGEGQVPGVSPADPKLHHIALVNKRHALIAMCKGSFRARFLVQVPYLSARCEGFTIQYLPEATHTSLSFVIPEPNCTVQGTPLPQLAIRCCAANTAHALPPSP
eukprot:gene4122-752_t